MASKENVKKHPIATVDFGSEFLELKILTIPYYSYVDVSQYGILRASMTTEHKYVVLVLMSHFFANSTPSNGHTW